MSRLVFLFGFTMILSGCGSSGVNADGSVQRGGKPLAAGYITFDPDAKTASAGPSATINIIDGKFRLEPRHKLVPGKYHVRIGPPPGNSGSGDKPAADYFSPWQTTADLTASGAPLTFDVPVK